MKRLSAYIFVLTACALIALGADKPKGKHINAQLADIRSIFEKSTEKIEIAYLDTVDKCLHSYATSLQNAETSATKEGDLDAVLGIRNEKKRFSQDRAVSEQIPKNAHKSIKQAMASYLEELNKAEATRNRDIAALSRQYLQHLETLKKKLTMQQNIDDALRVKAELDRASNDPSIKNALSNDTEPKASPTSAGCPACKGSGSISQPCPSCSASGSCKYCEGSGTRPGLGGKRVPCFACNGSKKCKKCSGTGSMKSFCSKCGGTGRGR